MEICILFQLNFYLFYIHSTISFSLSIIRARNFIKVTFDNPHKRFNQNQHGLCENLTGKNSFIFHFKLQRKHFDMKDNVELMKTSNNKKPRSKNNFETIS